MSSDIIPTETVRSKPLNGREQRNLEKIIQNDFDVAIDGIHNDAEKYLKFEIERIEREYAVSLEDKIEAAQDARELKEKLVRMAEEFYSTVKNSRNLVPGRDHYKGTKSFDIFLNTQFVAVGMDEALAKLRRDVDRARSEAVFQLRTQQRQTARKVLLAGISTEAAQDILIALPKPGEALKAAMEAIDADQSTQQ